MYHNKPIRSPEQDIVELPSFTIPEAAVSLGLNRRTLLDWYAGDNPVLRASGNYRVDMLLLSFNDLEEAYRVHLLRTRKPRPLSLDYLREALTDARAHFNSEHPLLTHSSDLAVYVEKRGRAKLIASTPGRGRRRRVSRALASPETPYYIPEVIKAWGERIVSGRQIFPWREYVNGDRSKPVSLDPDVLSGRLVVYGTRIPVSALVSRSREGEEPERIAEDYKLPVKMVKQALVHVGIRSEAA